MGRDSVAGSEKSKDTDTWTGHGGVVDTGSIISVGAVCEKTSMAGLSKTQKNWPAREP